MSKKTTIDASGLSCPQPVILTKKALQEYDKVTVIVDNTTAVENITRLAGSMKCEIEKTGIPDGKFELTLIKTGSFNGQAAVEPDSCDKTCSPVNGLSVAVVNSDAMGKGNDELGVLLMKAFLHTVTELDIKPDIMIFYNTGVKLTVSDSPAIDDLKKLQELGVRILICGTCVNFFNLKDKLAVGILSNMYDIAGIMTTAGRIIQP
jgi:selenium metabolism protein YedF